MGHDHALCRIELLSEDLLCRRDSRVETADAGVDDVGAETGGPPGDGLVFGHDVNGTASSWAAATTRVAIASARRSRSDEERTSARRVFASRNDRIGMTTTAGGCTRRSLG